MRNQTKQALKNYIIAIAIPLVLGGLSALITMGNMGIYKEVKTPPLSPPSFLFPVAWTILYILMGVSSAIVWRNRENDRQNFDRGMAVYALSLAFNFAWSILFFNFRWFLFSFFWLLALFILIVVTILCYRKISPVAAYLQIPYAIWVAFAGYLNVGIWFLNR